MKVLILFSVILISLTGSGQETDTLCIHNWVYSGMVYLTAPPINDQICTKCKIHRDEPFKMGKHGGEQLFPNDTTETIEDLVNRAIAVQNKETHFIKPPYTIDSMFISTSDSVFISKWNSDHAIKTDTVKGWIRYWKRTVKYHYGQTYDSAYLSGSHTKVVVGTHVNIPDSNNIEEVIEPAMVIYVRQYEEVPCAQTSRLIYLTGCHEWVTKSSKILINGREFDLSTKRYEFIKEEEMVK